MTSSLEVTAATRLDTILEALDAAGLPIDRSLSRYEEEPDRPGTWLVEAWARHHLDRPPDQPVFVRITEWWAETDEAPQIMRGFGLVRSHLHATVGRREVRYCYEPCKRKYPVHHWHPPEAPDDHRPHDHATADEGIDYFLDFVASEVLDGRIG